MKYVHQPSAAFEVRFFLFDGCRYAPLCLFVFFPVAAHVQCKGLLLEEELYQPKSHISQAMQ